ncbi:hypothetical protein [Siphonobacter sp.]|uniref:hypothetical protein n=1 Tax=Siphonobacter sp. TaxID=1869184 RepID=UPI003B3BB7AB
MKTITLLSILLLSFSGCEDTTRSTATDPLTIPSAPPKPSIAEPGAVTLQFLRWYQTHESEISALPLVNPPADSTAFYSVNQRATERYLALFNSSKLVSPEYLAYWKTYFEEAERHFQTHPQHEGPPEGFEYDLVLQSQEVDLEQLTQAQVILQTIEGNRAHVLVRLPDQQKLRFTLQNQQNHWLIDRIGAE